MKYALGNMLNGAGGLNSDGLALDLQFAADKTLTARRGPTPVLTRGSTGTFVGSNGLIQSAGNNVARFGHDPVTLASRGLLIEEGRTNQALYSGTWIAGIGWGTNTNTIASGVGPDGNTAYELSESAASQIQAAGNTGTTTALSGTSVTSGVTYTGSAFVKKVAGNIDWIQIALGSGGFGTTQYANINLSNGTIGNSSGGTARVEPHANGWYRVSFTANATVTTATSISVVVGFIQNTNGTVRFPTYSGSPSNKFLVAMAQFEAGSFATSYIPTTTSALARSADVCSITGTNFTNLWNASEGTMFASGNTIGTASKFYFYLNAQGSPSTSNAFLTNFGASAAVIQKDTPQAFKSDATISSSIPKRLAYAYTSGATSSSSINGLIPTPSTNNATASVASASTLEIGGTSTTSLSGWLTSVRYYKKRLSNQKLQALTA